MFTHPVVQVGDTMIFQDSCDFKELNKKSYEQMSAMDHKNKNKNHFIKFSNFLKVIFCFKYDNNL